MQSPPVRENPGNTIRFIILYFTSAFTTIQPHLLVHLAHLLEFSGTMQGVLQRRGTESFLSTN